MKCTSEDNIPAIVVEQVANIRTRKKNKIPVNVFPVSVQKTIMFGDIAEIRKKSVSR